MILRCDKRYCPVGVVATLTGIATWVFLTLIAINDVYAGVRVDMTRELPNETQHIVRTFEDKEDFEMWMSMRLEDGGCDPYITKMVVNLNNDPI